MKNQLTQRLESLDILRGFDLFMLVGLEMTMHQLSSAIDTPIFHSFMWCFTHVDWEGFSTWDLVMPLSVIQPSSVQREKPWNNMRCSVCS